MVSSSENTGSSAATILADAVQARNTSAAAVALDRLGIRISIFGSESRWRHADHGGRSKR
jgi:hypothetical protein